MDPSNSPDTKDRISALPDSLIHHILSFIDMIYAVQSSVLSKRWRYIWTSLPTLNFGLEDASSVPEFVNKVLWFRDSCPIQRFYLHKFDPDDEDFYSANINSWISVAVRRNVEELEITCICYEDFVIPSDLCSCKSLSKLYLDVHNGLGDRCKIILPTSVSLPRLKLMRLDLENLLFDNEYLTNNFFASCPALESLDLGNSEFGDMNLNISSLKLRHFASKVNSTHFVDTFFTDRLKLTLYAPNLITFKCSAYKLRYYFLENVSSLVTAYISLSVEEDDKVPGKGIELLPQKKELYARRMMELVKNLQNVESLGLSNYLMVLSEAPAIVDDQLPQFLNLRTLRLTTWLSRDCAHAIKFLLEISPNIESLWLDITKIQSDKPSLFPFCDEINFNSLSQEDCWVSGLCLPVLYHLKSVKIRGLQGCVNELKLIEILLKNSMVLETVDLSSDSINDDPHTKRRMMKFYEILLTFPRASRCTISTLNSGDGGSLDTLVRKSVEELFNYHLPSMLSEEEAKLFSAMKLC